MATWTPDPSFYPSPRMAMSAPAERLAYVAMLNVASEPQPDALGVVDVDPASSRYGQLVGRVDMPNTGDELHHFGWNACSSALCPYAPHPHIERRYLIVPGLRSSRIHILDTKADPVAPRIIKVIEPEELAARANYSRPHTLHCGPEGIYISALGNGAVADGVVGSGKAGNGKADDSNGAGGGPGGVFLMDHQTFEVLGQWEIDRGPQFLGYDVGWHLGQDTLITSEWGTPAMIENGLDPDLLLNGKYGHCVHFWDLRKRRHLQTIDLGAEYQLALELRPAHDPTKSHGFMNAVVNLTDLSSSIWLWYRDGGQWAMRKVIDIPAESADEDQLPPMLKGFKAVPPLVTDIDLSLDDKWLYVSCWGTGEMRRYDVSDPFAPKLTASVRLGGIVGRSRHPAAADTDLNGGPQMVEVSRDGTRVYFTNSLYRSWDDQFYPDGIKSWMVKLDATPDGALGIDERFFLRFDDEFRAHQIRLEGGDASSDSYCYP